MRAKQQRDLLMKLIGVDEIVICNVCDRFTPHNENGGCMVCESELARLEFENNQLRRSINIVTEIIETYMYTDDFEIMLNEWLQGERDMSLADTASDLPLLF